MKGNKMFESLSRLDEVDNDNKYFKWYMRKLDKDPLFSVDYKKQY